MKHRRQLVAISALFGTLVAIAIVSSATAVDKLVDKTLLPHDPSPEGVYRWSEGSIINLDGKKHLMMLVTAIGFGGHDDTSRPTSSGSIRSTAG